jgi:hypothetical protein
MIVVLFYFKDGVKLKGLLDGKFAKNICFDFCEDKLE